MTCICCACTPDAALTSGCACDVPAFPPCDVIPPGLSYLPRQVLGFPQYRENLLSTAALRPEFMGWAARAVDDLGVLLLESWAYVLDILQFYDRRIAEESYLRTARDPAAIRRLVALTGYLPRPAVASSALVAALADGRDPAVVPTGTQFRSKSTPGIPAQTFETGPVATIDPRTNSWKLAPIRKNKFSGLFAFAPGEPGVLQGQIVAVLDGITPKAAATVASVAATNMADGIQYRVATLEPTPSLGFFPPQLSDVRLYTMAQNAAPSPFPVDPSTTPQSGSSSSWVLDSLYPQILADDLVVIETPSGLRAARVQAASIASIVIGSTGSPAQPILGKASRLDFWWSYEVKRIHFRAIPAGRLTNPALPEIPVGELAATLDAAGAYVELDDPSKPSQFLVAGAGNAGAEVAGSVAIDANGSAKLTASEILDSAADKLAIPISYYGNLLKVTRGESVLNEVLGSGDSSQAFQKFRLKKKPLTYLPDPSRPGAVSPELQVRVNGILWRQVDSLVTAPKGERVYIVRHDENGETDIIFGDEVRPQTGVSNIVANYRYGAGKAAPPAGQLTQIAGKVPGLGQIVAPLPAGGGADAESPASIKVSAPLSMLSYGRAVSIDDYAAIAAAFPGVIAADVEWAWAKNAQTAGVQAWIVADGGTVAQDLQATLENAGDPLVAVTVTSAIPDSHDLNLTIAIAAGYLAANVEAAVTQALADPDAGLLAPPNIGIGDALFRSRIARAAGDVAGVAGIDHILVDGLEMPNAVSALQGHYLSFDVSVGAAS
jgi:hypothetical protein